MTTIVYRDGVLAADTRAYSGGGKFIGKKQKIFSNQYRAFGISTPNPGFSEEIRDWFLNDKHNDHEPIMADRSFEAVEITIDGVFYYKDNFSPSGPLDAPYIAIGSGDEYAMGALSMGACAELAVQIAGENDPWTGNVIQRIVIFEEAKDENEDQQGYQHPQLNEVDILDV